MVIRALNKDHYFIVSNVHNIIKLMSVALHFWSRIVSRMTHVSTRFKNLNIDHEIDRYLYSRVFVDPPVYFFDLFIFRRWVWSSRHDLTFLVFLFNFHAFFCNSSSYCLLWLIFLGLMFFAWIIVSYIIQTSLKSAVGWFDLLLFLRQLVVDFVGYLALR